MKWKRGNKRDVALLITGGAAGAGINVWVIISSSQDISVF